MPNTDFDKFAKTLRFKVEAAEPDFAKASALADAEFLNGVDIAHGGFLFSLADYATAVAANGGGRTAVSSSSSIEYMAPCPKGAEIVANAKIVAGNAKTALYQCIVGSADGSATYCVFTSRMVFKKTQHS